MLNKIKENFKIKYLLFLLVLPILFIFKNVGASTTVNVYSWDDLTRYTNYRVSNGDIIFDQWIAAYHNEKTFPSYNESYGTAPEYYCNKVKDGLRQISEFHATIIGCSFYAYSRTTTSAGFEMNVSAWLTKEEYNAFKKHVESESKNMLAKTTNKEELIKIVLDHVYVDILGSSTKTNSNGYFDRSSSLGVTEKTNVLSSLFFHYLGIDHRIVKGKANYGDTTYWLLINLNNTWSHCSVKTDSNRCFLTDSEHGKYYTWDYSAYPKATEKYVVNSTTLPAAKFVPIVQLPDPKVEIEGETSTQPTQPTNPTTPVSPNDVPSSWADVQVKEAIKNGLVFEQLQGAYRQPITREEFASILTSLHMAVTNVYPDLIAYENPFKDLPGSYYSESVIYANHLGLVSGVATDRYAPNNLITREQIAVMFKRLIDKVGYKYTVSPNYVTFADESEISSWAKESVQLLNKLEVMSGVGNNKINPKGNTTREQAMILANRVYNMMK